jgi:hypothetical protein
MHYYNITTREKAILLSLRENVPMMQWLVMPKLNKKGHPPPPPPPSFSDYWNNHCVIIMTREWSKNKIKKITRRS